MGLQLLSLTKLFSSKHRILKCFVKLVYTNSFQITNVLKEQSLQELVIHYGINGKLVLNLYVKLQPFTVM
jgi:hypothetical protein